MTDLTHRNSASLHTRTATIWTFDSQVGETVTHYSLAIWTLHYWKSFESYTINFKSIYFASQYCIGILVTRLFLSFFCTGKPLKFKIIGAEACLEPKNILIWWGTSLGCGKWGQWLWVAKDGPDEASLLGFGVHARKIEFRSVLPSRPHTLPLTQYHTVLSFCLLFCVCCFLSLSWLSFLFWVKLLFIIIDK